MTIKDLHKELVFQITNIRRNNALGIAEQLLMTGMIAPSTHQALILEINTKTQIVQKFLENNTEGVKNGVRTKNKL